MKRIYLPLTAMLLLCMLPIAALAKGETSAVGAAASPMGTATPSVQTATATPAQQSTAQPQQTEAGAVSLEIDDKNIYDGMAKAYQDGYVPKVKSRVATVVLPLIADGAIRGSVIQVTPGLGDTASSPFVFKNYQKTVKLLNNTIHNGSAKVASYLVRFDLKLKSGRVNGVYPVTISVQAQAADGSTIQQTYTSYVTVTDGINPNATPEPTQASSQPKVIVSGYSVKPSPVTAGQDFTVTITLRNTSETQSVQNMKVTAAIDSPSFTLKNSTDTIFIDTLPNGETTDVVLQYKASLKTAAQQYNITLTIDYDNADAGTLSSTGTVAFAVEQPLRVQIEAPKIASSVNAGDTLPITFQVMNLGRSMIYNVRCELDAPGLIPSGTAFIGNMEAGTAKTGEMDVFVGTKDMSKGHEKDEKYGATNGTVTLIYEDEDGKQYTSKTDFNTTINEPVISQATAAPAVEPKKAGQWWVSILAGAVILAGLAVLLLSRGKRRGMKYESD